MDESLDSKGKKDEIISSNLQTQEDASIFVKNKKALKKKNIPFISNPTLDNMDIDDNIISKSNPKINVKSSSKDS